MKKRYLYKRSLLTVLLICSLSSMTVSASSKTFPEPEGSITQEVTNQSKAISGPLTPEGNLALVDDYGTSQAGKQFITVETKNGKFFYIIIDRDDNGMETVHFLNKVDEEDLLAVMEEDAVQEYLSSSAEKETPEDKTGAETEGASKGQEETAGGETESEESVVVGLPPLTSILLIGSIMGAGGIGGYFYLKKNKKKQETDEPEEDEEEEELPDELGEIDLDDEDLDI